MQKHISRVLVGDIITCRDGEKRTVCQKDIKENCFLGRSIFGDSWNYGSILVETEEVPMWQNGKRIN